MGEISMAKHKNAPLNRHTFFKLFTIFLIIMGGVFLGLHYLNSQTTYHTTTPDLDQLETIYENRVDSLIQNINLQIKRHYHRLLLSAFDEINENLDVKPQLEKWLANNQNIWVVTLWQKDQNWPIRILKNNFWDNPEIKILDEKARRVFFSQIFNNDKIATDQLMIETLNGIDLTGLDLYTVSMDPKHSIYENIQIVCKPVEIKEFVHLQLNNSEQLIISHNGQSVLRLNTFENTNVSATWKNKEYNTTRQLDYFNLEIHYTCSVTHQEAKLTWLQENVYLFLGGLFTFGFFLCILASNWITKPIHDFSENALTISQGDLYGVIPPQKSDELNQLSNIINYMAHELARMQELNVGQIISDKIQTEAILRNIADGVIVTDRDKRILIVNKVAETWFGFKEKEIQSKKISQFLQIDTLIELIDDLQRGKSRLTTEFKYIPFDSNQEKIFQANASRVTNEDNELIGIVTAIRDVTREREIDRIKTELVSMVAHELKSPLTSIFGFSELLLESNLKDPQMREYAHIIMTESSRLTDLVNKFLDLTRLESGRTEIKMNPFDLHSVIDKMLESHIRQTENKSIKVIKEIPDDLPLVVGDQDMIEQVLLNLYSNAVKYSPKRSKVGLEAKQENGYIIVSIIDNGYGIPKESLSHIFDKFYRVSDTKMDGEVEGSGLGLTLAKEIIQHHGGEIKVQSRLGVGSVFSFTLQKANV